MEYEEPLITCDRILELFTKERPAGISHSEINRSLGYNNGDPDSAFVLAALQKLTEEKYLIEQSASNFRISGETFTFKRNGGYRGLVERENRRAELKAAIDELGLKSTQSVIDTNQSIKILNDNTSAFYVHQRKTNNLQKLLTVAIMLSAVVSGAAATCTYYHTKTIDLKKEKDKSDLQLKVDKLESTLKEKTQKDSIFQETVKDSLKTISEKTKIKL